MDRMPDPQQILIIGQRIPEKTHKPVSLLKNDPADRIVFNPIVGCKRFHGPPFPNATYLPIRNSVIGVFVFDLKVAIPVGELPRHIVVGQQPVRVESEKGSTPFEKSINDRIGVDVGFVSDDEQHRQRKVHAVVGPHGPLFPITSPWRRPSRFYIPGTRSCRYSWPIW